MKIISLLGNCQMVTLCFYLQQLLDPSEYKINWLLYDPEFSRHLGSWSYKCKNKILKYEDSIDEIRRSDYIIYQEVIYSNISNPMVIEKLKKKITEIIKLPSIFLDINNYEASLEELKLRENKLMVNLKVSEIFERNRHRNVEELLLTKNHPTTFFFMELLKEIALKLNVPFFSDEIVECFMKDRNYMELPHYTPTKHPKKICHTI
jgi:hypothetical protein